MASLRECDWRFLLPARAGRYRDLALIGGTGELVARIVEAGIAERVKLGAVEAESADAVVVLRGEHYTIPLREAARMVAPGGVLYYEADRRDRDVFWLTPTGSRRLLGREGLRTVGAYWVRPGFTNLRFYLPLDRAAALRWYFRTSARSNGVRGFARTLACRAILLAGTRPWSDLVRRYALVAVRAGTAKEDVGLSILSMPDLPPIVHDARLRPAVIMNGSDELGRVVLLPFGPRDTAPRAAVKLSRVPSRNPFNESEQAGLVELRNVLGAEMAATVPAPLGLAKWGELSVSVESFIPGTPLSNRSGWGAGRRSREKDFRLAAEWLTEFHAEAPVSREIWTESDHEYWIVWTANQFLDVCKPGAAERELMAAFVRVGRTLVGERVPIVRDHYAYGPWNIHRQGDRIGVLDWEGFGPGLPLSNLLYFCNCWYHETEQSADSVEAFRRLFCDTSPDRSRAMVDRAIEKYSSRLGLPGRFRGIALTHLWASRAISIAERMGLLRDESVPDARFEFVRVLAENRERLFPASPDQRRALP